MFVESNIFVFITLQAKPMNVMQILYLDLIKLK